MTRSAGIERAARAVGEGSDDARDARFVERQRNGDRPDRRAPCRDRTGSSRPSAGPAAPRPRHGAERGSLAARVRELRSPRPRPARCKSARCARADRGARRSRCRGPAARCARRRLRRSLPSAPDPHRRRRGSRDARGANPSRTRRSRNIRTSATTTMRLRSATSRKATAEKSADILARDRRASRGSCRRRAVRSSGAAVGQGLTPMAPDARSIVPLDAPRGVVDLERAVAVLDLPPRRRLHVKRKHVVIRMSPERRRDFVANVPRPACTSGRPRRSSVPGASGATSGAAPAAATRMRASGGAANNA